MENSYGIGVTNRYALFLDDESDPMEALKIKEQEKELKKKSKAAEKENKGKTEAPAKLKPAQPPKKVIKEVPNKVQETKREEGKPRSIENKPERNFIKFNNENREERNNRRNREDRQFNGSSFENNREREDRPKREAGDFENRRTRPAGGNKAPGRGGQRRQFDDRRGKREFDRQSGSDKTGVKAIDKRDGGGAHNWGSNKDIIDEADTTTKMENDNTWVETEKPEAANVTGEIKEVEVEPEPAPVEEEPKELTLDEWKAQRAGRQKPTYNLRKAGEGEDPLQWKKMYELNKKKAGEGGEDSEDDEYETSEYPQRVGRQKHVLGIDFRFNDNRRGGPGRGRGIRTGGRGGAGTRVNKDNRDKQQGSTGTATGTGTGTTRFRADELKAAGDDKIDTRNAPKVDDERDFPSLG